MNILIPTDCLTKVRNRVRTGWDAHILPLPDGRAAKVRRIAAESLFPGESHKPQYASVEAVSKGQLMGATVGRVTVWWLLAEDHGTGLSHDAMFRLWDALNNWLDTAVPVLEQQLAGMSKSAVLIVLDFGDVRDEQVDALTEDEVRSQVSVSVDENTNGAVCG